MSDETSEARPSRGPGLILSGLAASAVLGAPVVAAAAPVIAEPATTVSTAVASQAGLARSAAESIGASIREQFRTAFTPGVVTELAEGIPTVICDDR